MSEYSKLREIILLVNLFSFSFFLSFFLSFFCFMFYFTLFVCLLIFYFIWRDAQNLWGWAIILFYFTLFYMYLLFLLWQYLLLSLKQIFITFGKYLSQHYLTQRRTGGQASMLLNVTRALLSLLHCSRWPSQQPLNMDYSPSRTYMNFRQCVNH